MTKEENIDSFEKLEFWALTALFVFCLPLYFGSPGDTIQYIVVFLALLYINFRIAPALIRGEHITRNVWILAALFVVVAAPFSFGLSPKETVIVGAQVFVAIAGHIGIKHLARFILSKATPLQDFFVIVNRDNLILLGLWMIILYWALVIRVPTEVRYAWITVIPTGILLHGLAFRFFLPVSLRWKYPLVSYFFKVALFCLADAFIIGVVMMLFIENEDDAFEIGAFSGIMNMIFVAPALLLIYRWQTKRKEQIFALQGALSRSTANLDLVRSQINPHFLFNALNTIYGLAIQEKAERTSASVEKLGEMMRFMLLENMQERISLKRELEYLDNYINLQRLRFDASPGLTIRVEIPQEVDPAVRIAPMLLVSFVENAFKHGISLREPSYIKISLELKNSTLYFDVSNSIHQKMENDPEKDSNGIGLENVRQRLQHMYAGRHDLLVRPTSHDFFVHLRMELD